MSGGTNRRARGRLVACAVLASAIILGVRGARCDAAPTSHPSAPQQQATSGLTDAQLADLRSLDFAVVPQRLPSGFHVVSVSVDTKAKKYTVLYAANKDDNQEMQFTGVAEVDAPRGAAGLFGRMQSLYQGATGQASSASSSAAGTKDALRSQNTEAVTPETEAENTDVVSNSPLVGPIHFTVASGGTCIQGSPDKDKALPTGGHLIVSACNLTYPDPVIRAYKSLGKP